MTKVLIAIPTADGWIHSNLIRSIIPQMQGRPLAISAGMVPCEKARNHIVETFLSSDCTHVFMVDADTIPPDDAIDRLLKLDTDIATGITPIVNNDGVTSNIFVTTEEEGKPLSMLEATKKKDLFEITGVGMACVLIKREVFEKLKKPVYAGVWFQNSKFVEGDIHFCGNAKEAGFKIMCDPTIVCHHVKQITL